jgi:hypothetical protein
MLAVLWPAPGSATLIDHGSFTTDTSTDLEALFLYVTPWKG